MEPELTNPDPMAMYVPLVGSYHFAVTAPENAAIFTVNLCAPAPDLGLYASASFPSAVDAPEYSEEVLPPMPVNTVPFWSGIRLVQGIEFRKVLK